MKGTKAKCVLETIFFKHKYLTNPSLTHIDASPLGIQGGESACFLVRILCKSTGRVSAQESKKERDNVPYDMALRKYWAISHELDEPITSPPFRKTNQNFILKVEKFCTLDILWIPHQSRLSQQ